MQFNPDGTNWSVAEINNDAHVGSYHEVPWQFHNREVHAGTIWKGTYTSIPGSNNGYHCEIIRNGVVTDAWDVYFVTSYRFVGVKNDALYRFGRRV